MLSPFDITNDLLSQFKGLKIFETYGETSFFYNPDDMLKRGIYFCTLKEKDGPNDKASNLNRDHTFRINFGLPKPIFLELFQTLPKRPEQGCMIDDDYDFEALDTLTPHPVYGWMAWVCILTPSQQTWDDLKPLLTQSYDLCRIKYAKRIKAI